MLVQMAKSACYNQRRRQEYFQGRALEGSRGGLPCHFSISRGVGLNPDFWSLQWSKWNGPPCLCLPTPLATICVDVSVDTCDVVTPGQLHERHHAARHPSRNPCLRHRIHDDHFRLCHNDPAGSSCVSARLLQSKSYQCVWGVLFNRMFDALSTNHSPA